MYAIVDRFADHFSFILAGTCPFGQTADVTTCTLPPGNLLATEVLLLTRRGRGSLHWSDTIQRQLAVINRILFHTYRTKVASTPRLKPENCPFSHTCEVELTTKGELRRRPRSRKPCQILIHVEISTVNGARDSECAIGYWDKGPVARCYLPSLI